MISSGTHKILIDAFAKKGFGLYLSPFKTIREKLENSKEPLNNINLININGIKIFHVGDATLSFNEEFIPKFQLDKENIDIVFLTYFDCSKVNVDIINRLIRPKEIIAMYISPAELEKIATSVRQVYPNVIIFKESMERKIL